MITPGADIVIATRGNLFTATLAVNGGWVVGTGTTPYRAMLDLDDNLNKMGL